MKKLFIMCLFLTIYSFSKADEGMWLLKDLSKESAARMKELGFKFPISDLYNENNPSLKDAVVIFGRGCTGVTVSDKGLIFTNHHCGYGDIQKLSSVEHDYLKNGFVSHSNAEELPAEGLTVSYLSKTEDITDILLKNVSENDSEKERRTKIDSLANDYLKSFDGNEFQSARIVPFYSHNKYYLVVYDVFKDVRLTFTPPSSVGKFGGETDNWMWPRHTGDFSVFRVYADKDNKPANYSEDNVPYTPKYHVPVSIKGYKADDYTMTIGYPGSTQRYIPSWGITEMVESKHKPRIEVRGQKQAIWKDAMYANDTVRIKYSNKYAGSSNYWKNAIGMNAAIKKLNVVESKEQLEGQFASWVSQDKSRTSLYNNTLSSMKDGYLNLQQTDKVLTYFTEVFLSGTELTSLGNMYVAAEKADDQMLPMVMSRLNSFYKDYEPSLDKKVTISLLKLYADSVSSEFYPSIYERIKDEFSNDYELYVNWVFDNSKLITPTTDQALISELDSSVINDDPLIEFSNSVMTVYANLRKLAAEDSEKIAQGTREYMAGLMEMNANKALSPDANFTQRMSYGTVKSYSPADAIDYSYYTTVKGVLEKVDPLNPEFALQPYIIKDLESNDFGQYKDKNGTMQVNFLSTNDITGGNSGSPVFNGDAELIGLAFDGNWEALSGDIVFNSEVQRCINVDIRYVLYMIDKVGKCDRLIQELTIKNK